MTLLINILMTIVINFSSTNTTITTLWEQLFEQPSCINATSEHHIMRGECSVHVCAWEKISLVFLICDMKKTECLSIINDKIDKCDIYENKVKF